MAMYCAQCGKESQEDARFCSACGRQFSPEGSGYTQGAYRQPAPPLGTLRRPRMGRKIAGVCQGIANHYGWDVSVVRVVMLLLAIAGFPIGLIVYGLVWLIAPEEPLALPSATYVSQG
jgi:phage shock protein C